MFAKVFNQIFDSSIAEDYNCRRMFMDLLVLADSDGVVDMTHEAIARRTNVPIAEVTRYIAELQQPDEASRSKMEEGRRITPIDATRGWGWRIVNYRHYRNIRDEEARRSYFRDQKRRQRKKQDVQDIPVDNGGRCQITASASSSVSASSFPEGFKSEWEAFRKHRRLIKHPMTQRAEELLLKRLEERPQDAISGLQCAILNNWRGFEWDWFDSRTVPKNASLPVRQMSAFEIEKRIGAINDTINRLYREDKEKNKGEIERLKVNREKLKGQLVG